MNQKTICGTAKDHAILVRIVAVGFLGPTIQRFIPIDQETSGRGRFISEAPGLPQPSLNVVSAGQQGIGISSPRRRRQAVTAISRLFGIFPEPLDRAAAPSGTSAVIATERSTMGLCTPSRRRWHPRQAALGGRPTHRPVRGHVGCCNSTSAARVSPARAWPTVHLTPPRRKRRRHAVRGRGDPHPSVGLLRSILRGSSHGCRRLSTTWRSASGCSCSLTTIIVEHESMDQRYRRCCRWKGQPSDCTPQPENLCGSAPPVATRVALESMGFSRAASRMTCAAEPSTTRVWTTMPACRSSFRPRVRLRPRPPSTSRSPARGTRRIAGRAAPSSANITGWDPSVRTCPIATGSVSPAARWRPRPRSVRSHVRCSAGGRWQAAPEPGSRNGTPACGGWPRPRRFAAPRRRSPTVRRMPA